MTVISKTSDRPTSSSYLSLTLYAVLVCLIFGLSLVFPPLAYLLVVSIFSFAHHFQGVYRIIAHGGGLRSSLVHRKILRVVVYLCAAILFYNFFGQRASLVTSWIIGTAHYFLDAHFMCRSKPTIISLITGFSLALLQVSQAFEFRLFDLFSFGVFLIGIGVVQIIWSHFKNKKAHRPPTYVEYELGVVAILFAAIVMLLPPHRVPYLFNLLAMLHILNWYYSLHFHVQAKGSEHFSRYYKEVAFFIILFGLGGLAYSLIESREKSLLHFIYNPLFLSVWLNGHIAATFDGSRLSWLSTNWFRKSVV